MTKSWVLALRSVAGGARGALDGSCLLHNGTNSGEGGDEVLEGRRDCGAGVADGEGDELHPSPVFPEGRNEGVFSVFFSILMT